jgi:hypothetical protein
LLQEDQDKRKIFLDFFGGVGVVASPGFTWAATMAWSAERKNFLAHHTP